MTQIINKTKPKTNNQKIGGVWTKCCVLFTYIFIC